MNRSVVNSGRFKYPRAIPAPPIYSSPVTPTGTGNKFYLIHKFERSATDVQL